MIDYVNKWFRPVLPLVYDDAISYYEQLCKFSDKLNEVIETVNNFHQDISEEIDTKVGILKKYVDAENVKQDEKHNEDIKEVYNKIESVYEYINKQVSILYEYINRGDLVLRLYIDEQIKDLKKYVDNSVMAKIKIYDPTCGYKNNLDVVMEHIYDALRYKGITCFLFDTRRIDCTNFDIKYMSALDFDTLSLEIIGNYYPHYAYNPYNGNYDTLQRILYMLVQATRVEAITATLFDSVAKVAEALDSLAFTSLDFDERAKVIIIP